MFGSDGSPIVQYVLIFAIIFTALAAIVFVVRRLTGQALPLPGRSGARGRQPRLGIVDVYELDRARQLILLRRDNVEHLLLVGGPNDVVVERNIQRGQRPLPEAALRPEPVTEALTEPLPDPLAGAGRLPEPQRALPEGAGRRAEPLFDPGFKMPVVVPPPVPGSGNAPPVTLPLDAGLVGGDEPGQEVAAPLTVPPRTEPAPAPAAAPSGRERFSARRLLGRTNPAPPAPRPEPAPERRADRPAEAETVLPPPPLPRERRSVDPAILSDMARQLQAALARPASAVTPAPPVQPEPAEPAPVDPVAAAMAAAPPTAIEPVAPPRAEPPASAPPSPVSPSPVPPYPVLPRAASLPPVKPAAAPTPAAPPRQAPPVAGPATVPPPPDPAPKPTPAPEANAAGNPFSVEEIEAEFARLLGRPLDKRG